MVEGSRVQLTSFSVYGFRLLSDVAEVPMRCPTVLTGRNDSGKSSTLAALAFLLNNTPLGESDFPNDAILDGDRSSSGPATITVTGQFELTVADREVTGLPDRVRVRRVATREAGPRGALYEVEHLGPANPELRNLGYMRKTDLQLLAERLGVKPVGDLRSLESFRVPLAEFAAAQPQVLAWENAGAAIVDRLPRFLYRTGVESADVTGTILGALKSAYREILDNEKFRQAVDSLEAETERALSESAHDLCVAIESGVDGLSAVEIIPQVSFRDPVSNVQLFAALNGQRSPLEHSGTGRHKQVVQAVWEWERREVTKAENPERSVVIAYDEPDASLDYVRQRDFMDRARSQCVSGNVRMIIATHSVQIIDQVRLQDVVHLDRDGCGAAIVRRMPEDGTDADLTTFAGDLAEQLGVSTSAILFERCFLLVEGPTEKRCFPRLFRLATGAGMREAGIVLFEAEGNAHVLKLAEYLTQMNKPVFVMVDKDSLRDRQKAFSEGRLKNHGISDDHIQYLGDPNELEDLFSDAQWSDMANKHWRRQSGIAWTSDDFAQRRAVGMKFSAEVSSMLARESRSAASKPVLMARMAECITEKDDIPELLLAAFVRLLAMTRQQSDEARQVAGVVLRDHNRAVR
jgi:putative ATP-dependent endonuclease of the OLD family